MTVSLLEHNRRRWMILIVAHVTYVSFQSYASAIWITFAFDLFVNYFSFFWGPWRTIPKTAEGIILDLLLRAVTIVAGLTLNAFISYVFDLSHLHGTAWAYWLIVLLLYFFIRLLDMQRGDEVFGLDYLFPFAAMIFGFTFRDFMFYGEPYTYITMVAYALSVFFLSLTSSNERVKWWAVVPFFGFWIIVVAVTYGISVSIDREYKRPLTWFFKTHLDKIF